MHIRDGFLGPEVCVATGVVAAGLVAYSARKVQAELGDRTVPLTGMTAALIFAGQMVNFPLLAIPVSGHLLGGVLAAVLVGPWAGCLAVSLVLLVQLVLFYDGGWTVLGANVLNMACVGSLGGYALYVLVARACGGGVRGTVIGSVVAAWASVLAAAALFCGEFAATRGADAFHLPHIFTLMVLIHSGIGIGEAAITGLIVSFVATQRPELLYRGPTDAGTPLPSPSLSWGRVMAAGLLVALAVAAFCAPFASEYDDGLEAVATQTGFMARLAPPQPLWLEDYEWPGLGESWKGLAVSLAGITGTLAVFGLAWGLGRIAQARPLDGTSHAG